MNSGHGWDFRFLSAPAADFFFASSPQFRLGLLGTLLGVLFVNVYTSSF